jgi:hypothetical protein
MLERLFPRQIDNTYRGHWLALWLLAVVLFVKGIQGFMSIIRTREIATGPDAISLAGLPPHGVDTVLSLFALLGLYVLVLPLQGAFVLLRYRAAVPLMYLMLLILYGAGRLLHMLHPSFIATEHGASPSGFYVNLAVLGVTLAGFALSLLDSRKT